MQIIILNGGLGKRVKNISKNNPKCLIKFNKRPFLYHQINLLKKKGFKNFVHCLGFKHKKIINYINRNKNFFKDFYFSIEKKKLDTGGALINASKYMNDYFFVTYGDSYLNINYKKILNKIKKNKKKCLITVSHKKYNKYHTPNLFISNNKIKAYKYSKKSNFIDYGVIVFKKECFQGLKVKKISLSFIIKSLIKKNLITYEIISKKFYEIGSLYGIKEFKKII